MEERENIEEKDDLTILERVLLALTVINAIVALFFVVLGIVIAVAMTKISWLLQVACFS